LAAINNLHHAREREEQVRQWNKALEQRIRERTAELEAFCHSLSHDLRAPLRVTTSFTQLLQEEYAVCFDEEGRNMLHTIIQSTQRMNQLLNDLLRLSNLSRKKMQRRTVNLSALVQGIAQDIQKSEPQRTTKFTITSNLTAQGDEALLRIALENLLGNAWKFTEKRADAQIDFGSEQQEGRQTYFVHDNGIGFDMTHATKLFGVFERLHPDAEFPGTGIGLAIVQRVITRHGGQIWAKAAPNQGATFCFTLPGQENYSQEMDAQRHKQVTAT
jgi:light-regulated signal transduction histidine kinase (bacteriophytochrome)